VSVIKNTCSPGNISFAAPLKLACGRGNRGVSLGDIDGDSKLDIATANSADHSISILMNTSTSGSITSSSFGTHVDFSTASAYFGPWDIVINDIDNDGKPDIIVTDGGGIFKNKASVGTITGYIKSIMVAYKYVCANVFVKQLHLYFILITHTIN
jgi:hypothetical protein